MYKTGLLVLIVLATAGHYVFANGTGETSGGMQQRSGGQAYFGEQMTLSGTLDLQPGNQFAVLQTSSGAWGLMLPRMNGYDVPVKNGDALTVTGFEEPGPQWNVDGGGRYLMVQKAVIAGKEYILPSEYEQYDMMGWDGDRCGHGHSRGGYDAPRKSGRGNSYRNGCWY